MPDLTSSSRGKFTVLFNVVREALGRVEVLLDAAIEANSVDDIVALAKARKTLKAQLFRLRELEMDYQASQRGMSEAEAALARGAEEARGHMRSVKRVADVINAVARLAATITRLLAFFP